MSKLLLVGAGPGDPEMITLKAVNALKTADVVLYDELVDRSLLSYCPSGCELVYVGKKSGIHQFQQIYINDMIVDYGKKYEHVIRLKGGDPFVFGRGHEELVHARSHGMEVEIIPGISSAVAVPAYNEIPLTKRGVNESFWVITGTTSSLELSSDIYLAAQSSATIIILMGMRNLHQIVDIFSEFRGNKEPVGIIQNGTKANEKKVIGELHEISNLVDRHNIGAPAIIIIGEVVTCASEFGDLLANADVRDSRFSKVTIAHD
ncbi:MAG: uroporphyrinogen-III C-methyltransferase [Bacteroidota bacterium]